MATTWPSLCCLVVCVLPLVCFAHITSSPPPPPPDQLFSGVQTVERNGATVLNISSGKASVEYGVDMTAHTAFLIGSNSKLFTAVSIYLLQEDGLLRTSDPVSLYLNASDFANFGFANVSEWCPTLLGSGVCQVVTFEHLMSMSSGLVDAFNCDYPPDSPFVKYCVAPYLWTVDAPSVASTVGSFILNPLTFVPGTNYSYSNPNFILLTYLIEKLSGLSYAQFLLTRIFLPLGLHHTTFDFFNQQFHILGFPFAGFYYDFRDPVSLQRYAVGKCSTEITPSAVSGTGGLVSTQGDMLRWYKALFVDRKLFRRHASLRALVKPWTRIPADDRLGLKAYYAQGVAVFYKDELVQAEDASTHTHSSSKKAQAPDSSSSIDTPWPELILYQGGTLCSHTAIILAFNSSTHDLTAITAFRNTVNILIPQSEWSTLQATTPRTNRTFLDSIQGLPTDADALVVAFQLLEYYNSNGGLRTPSDIDQHTTKLLSSNFNTNTANLDSNSKLNSNSYSNFNSNSNAAADLLRQRFTTTKQAKRGVLQG
eukprot:gnl/Spiro4/12190_TR6434_c0_g1_i1.p1 gnl/Spiro4/12190_TR6434_c0_g1~~gnl/Spiro4/12190_TR6434_c0_g1_i1.p1  ORF type:complete len:546 (+),score=151.98 gnl/Spiro4/12190_TR6434_c0_g1_i1:27-1640(+)